MPDRLAKQITGIEEAIDRWLETDVGGSAGCVIEPLSTDQTVEDEVTILCRIRIGQARLSDDDGSIIPIHAHDKKEVSNG